MEEDRLKTTIVPPSGNFRAKIVMIGEAPGEEEDLRGEPFVGSSGHFLKKTLAQKGIDISNILFHNCFQQRPPSNKVEYFFKDKSLKFPTWEGQEHLEALASWLTTVRDEGEANLVVALGSVPMRVLTGKTGIYKWRGSVLPCTLVEGLKVYCSFHPSHVMRSMEEASEGLQGEQKARTQNTFPLWLIDMDRIKYQAEFPDIRYPQRNYETTLSFRELLHKIEELNHARLVSCDIETLPGANGEGPLLWCIGFSPNPANAFVVPFIERLAPCWLLEQEAELHQAISRVFLNPKVRKVFQNGAYDMSVLGRYYGYRLARGSQEDTMLCHHASYPYLYKNLGVLTSIYTDEPFYKDEGKQTGSRNDQQEFVYNAKDCAVTREIMPVVERHAHELGTWDGYRRTMRIQPSLLGMMINGVRIDMERKQTLAREFAHKVRFYESEVQRLTGNSLNLSSSAQKTRFLYGELGLKLQFHHKTKRPTTDKDALQKLKRLYDGKTVNGLVVSDVLDCFIQRSKFKKLSTDYAEMTIEPDGRVRTSYSLVSTWRLNSSASHFGGGGNLQNIPKRSSEGREVRKLFITDPVNAKAPEDWDEKSMARLVGEKIAAMLDHNRQVMVAADLSQAEARVVAWEAEDLVRIDLFEAGWDVHWFNARMIFSIPENIAYSPETVGSYFLDQITGEEHTLKELRNIGKTVVHAGNYGMGPKMLQTILAREGFILDFMTCRNLLKKHKTRNPLLAEWQHRIRQEVQANRTLISSYGRKREFMGRMGDGLYKSAYAFSPQNTVGEMLTDAIQDIWEKLPELTPLLNVHDEVVGQCNPWDLEKVLFELPKLMERPLVIHGRTLVIPTDISIGRSWGELIEFRR